MSEYIITCESTADLSPEHFERRNIKYVSFMFNLDSKEYADDLGQTIPFEEFYKKISEGAMPTTSQVNVGRYIEFFEPMLEAGNDIIHIGFSSGISGSFNSLSVAHSELVQKYPQRKFLIIDSLAASSGYGLLMEMAADKRDEGYSIDDLYNWVEEIKLKIHHWFFSTDLVHYKRGGRISATSAMVGTLLNICPLMNVSDDGKLIPRRKIRTKKKVIVEIVKEMEEHAENGYDYDGKCFMCHSACYEDAKEVAELIEQKFPKLNGKVVINNVGTVIGSHTGPGTVALFFVGDPRVD